MQTEITPASPAPWALAKPVLEEGAFAARLHLLAPGAEYRHPHPHDGDRFVFVTSGVVTVENGRTHYILRAETALRLPAGSACSIRNTESELAKVLVADLPPVPAARGVNLVFPARA